MLLPELGLAKHHLLAASRECLLLVKSLLKTVDQMIDGSGSTNARLVQGFLHKARESVEGLSRWFPDPEEKKFDQIYLSVLDSICRVLDEEVQKNRGANPKLKTRREALQSIRTLLEKEIEERRRSRRERNH